MNLIKKLIVMLMCTVIVLGEAKGYMAEAAQEYSVYAIKYTGDGGDIATPSEWKETSSSAYIYNCYAEYGVWIQVWGKTKGTWKDCTAGGMRYCEVGQKRYLPNYVYEWNGNKGCYCYLKMSPATHKEACIGGRWNPDSNRY